MRMRPKLKRGQDDQRVGNGFAERNDEGLELVRWRRLEQSHAPKWNWPPFEFDAKSASRNDGIRPIRMTNDQMCWPEADEFCCKDVAKLVEKYGEKRP